MNEKIDKEIKKIKDFIKEWQGILLVISIVAVLIFLLGLKIYLNRSEKIKEIEVNRNCHYEAIIKAQEKYSEEVLKSSKCYYCNGQESEGKYHKYDYELYYQDCLKELNIK